MLILSDVSYVCRSPMLKSTINKLYAGYIHTFGVTLPLPACVLCSNWLLGQKIQVPVKSLPRDAANVPCAGGVSHSIMVGGFWRGETSEMRVGRIHCFHSGQNFLHERLLLLLSMLPHCKLGAERCVVLRQLFYQLHDHEIGLRLGIEERTSPQVTRRFGQEIRVALVKSIDRMTVFSLFERGLRARVSAK